MNPLEIALIIIGIIVIIVSCIIVDKGKSPDSQMACQPFSFDNHVSEEDKNKLMEKMNELLSDVSEETIIRTDDTLSKLSNEKIMAVSEFSDQILEKIKRNHEEVVFLYNMLNDKEKELKSAVKEIDSSKKKVQEILGSKTNLEKTQSLKNNNKEDLVKTEKSIVQTTRIDKQAKALEAQHSANTQEIQKFTNHNENSNTKILSLYSQGKSVMEISKLLELGQGEVKLVIDLFKGKK